MSKLQLDPIPSILIESMRDIGYSFESAIADIIDNSITAGAKHIQIEVRSEGNPAVAIIDDGDGLSRDQLIAAMRMGSTDPREQRSLGDLGRFGLGMKTASFSQCRRLTVYSSQSGVANAFTWDLDYVVETNSWSVIEQTNFQEVNFYNIFPSTGTVVLWEKIDRLGQQSSSRKKVTSSFERLVSDAEEHIALVFHRFLAGEPSCPKVNITLNGRQIEPLDPFNKRHSATILGPEELLPGGVVMQAYTLPHRKKYSSQKEYEKYGLRGGYQRNQGIYLYRAKRLIIHGTWFNLAQKTAVTQLCRVRIDIENTNDEDWKIDIRKVSAQLPEEARATIRRLLNRLSSPSKGVYKRMGAKQTTSASYPTWEIIKDSGLTRYAINRFHPTLLELQDLLNEDQARKLSHALNVIESGFPLDSLFVELTNNPETVATPVINDISYAEIVREFFAYLKGQGIEEQTIIDQMRSTPIFSNSWDKVLRILAINES